MSTCSNEFAKLSEMPNHDEHCRLTFILIESCETSESFYEDFLPSSVTKHPRSSFISDTRVHRLDTQLDYFIFD